MFKKFKRAFGAGAAKAQAPAKSPRRGFGALTAAARGAGAAAAKGVAAKTPVKRVGQALTAAARGPLGAGQAPAKSPRRGFGALTAAARGATRAEAASQRDAARAQKKRGLGR